MGVGKPLGLSPGSPNRIRRIEGGILDYASDMTAEHNPYEMDMGRLVNLNKGEFIGRAALAKIQDEGTERVVVGAFMDGPAFEKNNEHRWKVLDGSDVVGEIGSAVYSPRLERNIGQVLMKRTHAEVGTMLVAETPEGNRNLEVTTRPFVDPDKDIPRRNLRD